MYFILRRVESSECKQVYASCMPTSRSGGGSFSEARFSENPVEVVVGWKSNVWDGAVGKDIPREWRQVVTCGWTTDHQRTHVPRHEHITDLQTQRYIDTYTVSTKKL